MTNSVLDEYIDRAGAGAVLMVSLIALADIRNNATEGWRIDGNREFYRGALIEQHDEWSWGWMVRKANGKCVEAQGTEAQRAETENTGSVHDGPVAADDAPTIGMGKSDQEGA
jgi:hypothetical protein